MVNLLHVTSLLWALLFSSVKRESCILSWKGIAPRRAHCEPDTPEHSACRRGENRRRPHRSLSAPISLKLCPKLAEVLSSTAAVSSSLPGLDLATVNEPLCQRSLRFGGFKARTGLLPFKHFLDSDLIKAMEPLPGKTLICTDREKNKRGMPFRGTLVNCLTPRVAPEHPQFLPQPFAEGETEAGESRAEWGAGGRGRGDAPAPGAWHPRSEKQRLWGNAPNGKRGCSDSMPVTAAHPPTPVTPPHTGPQESPPETESTFTMNK